MSYKILFKYPSRGRPENFFSGLDSIVNNLFNVDDYHISCTLDFDDHLMNHPDVVTRIEEYENTSIGWGTSESKIHAVNRSMPDIDWDIIVCMSDDMRLLMYGFDVVIRQQFEDGNFDKLIHLPDRDAGKALAVMYIAGRTFYDRVGYIYNPIYKSLFCDNEIMDIAKRLNKYYYVDYPHIIEHLNPAYGYGKKDSMFIEQQEIGWTEDQKTYYERKSRNFDINLLPL